MRGNYPGDISRALFEEIQGPLEGLKKKAHPRTYDIYDIFCAVLYLVKEGYSWRAIPMTFPNGRMCDTTMMSEQYLTKTGTVFLTGFCANW